MREFLGDLLAFPVVREFLRAGFVGMLIVISSGKDLTGRVVEGVRKYPVGWVVGDWVT